jgi:hypothetical protein
VIGVEELGDAAERLLREVVFHETGIVVGLRQSWLGGRDSNSEPSVSTSG